MAPLTQTEVDGIMSELSPFLASDAKKVELGLGAYKALLTAKPEYIPLFSKLQGLTIDNVFQSEGIKYYARTLVEDLVKMLKTAAKDDELQKVLVQSGHQHTSRKVTKQQFMNGEPIFIDYFNKTLSKPENKAAMEKFLKHSFPVIANNI
ncbi:Myoglobin [Paragonimus heterotremus]|uniref:Myoglobin n=1 Tax=Paragonimus heterotremus TaxID=100268 RepID=A0A8J4TIS9_9TREM|nr:Myoglobin [Paragonimus heterotremus]